MDPSIVLGNPDTFFKVQTTASKEEVGIKALNFTYAAPDNKEYLKISGSDFYYDGTIRVSGDIKAENYIVSSSVMHMTQSFSEGSTIFGDTDTDIHQFTGSIFAKKDNRNIITLHNPTDGKGAGIKFSDDDESGQFGQFYYTHYDTLSNGAYQSFHFSGSEGRTAVIINDTAGASGYYIGSSAQGLTTSQYKVAIRGSQSSSFMGGNVGIGETIPEYALQIEGTTSTTNGTDSGGGLWRRRNYGAVDGNLIGSYQWTVGSGSVGEFSRNGSTAENIREMGLGPHGDPQLLWKSQNIDPATGGSAGGFTDGDGGFNTAYFKIDRSKPYRFTCCVKRNIGYVGDSSTVEGHAYLGVQNVTNLNSDSTNTNPYFWIGDCPVPDRWYLMVGYVWPSASVNGPDPNVYQNLGGLYDMTTGERVTSEPAGTSYKWATDVTTTRLRAYHYYNADTSHIQHFWNPRVEKLDGTESTLEQLISPLGGYPELDAGGVGFPYSGSDDLHSSPGAPQAVITGSLLVGGGLGGNITASGGISAASTASFVKAIVNGGDATIGLDNLANARLLVGTVNGGVGFDPNEIMFNGQDGHVGVISNHDLRFLTNATDRLFIQNDGKVGIGTIDPKVTLHVQSGSANNGTTTLRVGGIGGNHTSRLELAESLNQGNMTYGFSLTTEGGSGGLSGTTSNDFVIRNHQNSTAGNTAFSVNRESGSVSVNAVATHTMAKFEVLGTMRSTAAVIPTSGVGAEIEWNGTRSRLLSYDRDNSIYKPVHLAGSQIHLEEAGSTILFVDGSKVGIGNGSNAPSYTLDVTGDFRATSNIYANGNIIGDDGTDITNINQIYCDAIYHDNDTDTSMLFNTNQIDFFAGNSTNTKLQIGSTGIIINQNSQDYDFRVESNGNVNMLFVNGGTDKVGIGTTTPADTLEVAGGIQAQNMKLTTAPDTPAAGAVCLGESSNVLKIASAYGTVEIGSTNTNFSHFNTNKNRFYFNKEITVDTGIISSYNENLILRRAHDDTDYNQIELNDDSFTIKLSNDTRFHINSDGEVGIGTTSPDANLEVKRNDSNVSKMFSINQDGTGDAIMTFRLTGDHEYAMGIDNDDSNKFKISDGSTLGSSDRLTIDTTGRIGIATTSPQFLLHIKQTSDGDDTQTSTGGVGNAIIIENTHGKMWEIGADGENGNNELVFSHRTGHGGGFLVGQTWQDSLNFTGQHRTLPATGTSNNYSSSIGYIVIANGTYNNLNGSGENFKANINESLPKVELSNKVNDKRVFGVISMAESETDATRKYNVGIWGSRINKRENDHRLAINSLGEGAVWITNVSGSLENGDYITTSPIPGLGMKQDDDLLHNYTVAKITQDCDFRINSTKFDCVEFEWSGSTYRKAFVGCTYHCG